jgi:hypothetical protein
MKKPKPRPHNPYNLTKKQIGRAPWRLLDDDELYSRMPTHLIQCWSTEGVCWCDESVWQGNYRGNTYRTRLTRAQLRRLK